MKKRFNKNTNMNIKRRSVVLSGLFIISLIIITSIAVANTGGSEKNKSLDVQSSAISQIAGSSKFYQAPENPDFIKYEKSKTSSQISLNKYKTGFLPSPVDLSHLSQISTIQESFPSKYDLRTLNKVTSVQDQGNAGTCWAFATYGSLESYLMPGEYWDFSENNLKNVLSTAAPEGFDFPEGGTSFMSTAYLARWSGPVKESDDPYSDSSVYSPNELGLPVYKHVQDVLFLPSRQGPTDNDEIKSAIKKYGAVNTGIYIPEDFYNYYSNVVHSFYYDGSLSSNHGVDIVGWDDSYDKNNFAHVPSGNGAFIVKNSWGTAFGENGYFYVSYYDSNIGKTNYLFSAENTDNYNSVYQYDPLGWTNTIGCGNPSCWGANVFTAKSDETLKAISFYATDSSCKYQIYIYTNPASGPINETGSVLTQTGTSSTAGYHTVHLNTGIPLKAGQKFSVVLKLTTPNWNAPIAIEQPYDGYSSKAIANSSESFVSCDGNTWYDMTSIVSNTDVCIKAFTDTQSPVLKITKTATPTTYNTVGQKITYTYNVTNSGNVPVSGIAVKDNKATVKISSSTLAPGSSVQGTATYTITKADITAGSLTNSAYATGKFETQTVTSNQVTATVKVAQNPVLKITKTATPTTYNTVGQKITYTYNVTNSGNVPVSGIAVKDNKATVKNALIKKT